MIVIEGSGRCFKFKCVMNRMNATIVSNYSWYVLQISFGYVNESLYEFETLYTLETKNQLK